MKRRIVAMVMSAMMVVGMMCGQCLAAGSITVNPEAAGSTAKVNGEEKTITISVTSLTKEDRANTEKVKEFVDSFVPTSLPEEKREAVKELLVSDIVSQWAKEETAADRDQAFEEEAAKLGIPVSYKTVKKNADGTIEVIEGKDEATETFLGVAKSLGSFSVDAIKDNDGNEYSSVEDGKVAISVPALTSLQADGLDEEALLNSFRVRMTVALDDGSVEVRYITPVAVDLETGKLVFEDEELMLSGNVELLYDPALKSAEK